MSGPIENTHLLEEDGEELKKSINENFDFTIVNQATWDKLFEWYGGGPTIARTAIESQRYRNNISIELRKYRLQGIHHISGDTMLHLILSAITWL